MSDLPACLKPDLRHSTTAAQGRAGQADRYQPKVETHCPTLPGAAAASFGRDSLSLNLISDPPHPHLIPLRSYGTCLIFFYYSIRLPSNLNLNLLHLDFSFFIPLLTRTYSAQHTRFVPS
ncbi:hypothetical protein CEP53_004075 [Fusarium sp. AF-6]|nr:hypothetical protein CEP53_004075 [Fusarium sp. AF-6]